MQKQLGPISRFDTIPACKLIQTLRHSTYMRYAYVLHRRRAVKCVGLLSTEYARVLDAVQGKLGVLQLSLCYQPASETITIVIMKARDLKAKDINGLSGNTQLKRTQTHTHTHTQRDTHGHVTPSIVKTIKLLAAKSRMLLHQTWHNGSSRRRSLRLQKRNGRNLLPVWLGSENSIANILVVCNL